MCLKNRANLTIAFVHIQYFPPTSPATPRVTPTRPAWTNFHIFVSFNMDIKLLHDRPTIKDDLVAKNLPLCSPAYGSNSKTESVHVKQSPGYSRSFHIPKRQATRITCTLKTSPSTRRFAISEYPPTFLPLAARRVPANIHSCSSTLCLLWLRSALVVTATRSKMNLTSSGNPASHSGSRTPMRGLGGLGRSESGCVIRFTFRPFCHASL